MRILSDTKDLAFSDDFDFVFDSEKKDLKVVDDLNGQVTTQMVIKRVFSSQLDWKIHPECGANISAYKGFPLSTELLQTVKSAIITELTRDFLIDSGNISVKMIPLSKTRLSTVIVVKREYMQVPVVVSSGFSLDTYSPISDEALRR